MIKSTYNSIHPINNGNYILINSLSGAVDVVDGLVKERLDRIEQTNLQRDNQDEVELLTFSKKEGISFIALQKNNKYFLKLKMQWKK